MKAMIPSVVFQLFFLVILLGCAGRFDYWSAWIYVATGLLMSFLTRFVLRNNPELLDERNKPKPDAKDWDKRLLATGFLLTLAMLVVAGLDAGRFQMQPRLTWPFLGVGMALNLLGMGLFLWSIRENRFFSSVVRIQHDRGHTLCNTGPYRRVRHPGYLGMIIGTLGIPLLLVSAWSAIPALLFVLVVIIRTYLEDTALQAELAGYREYCQSTRYRLVPGAW